MRCIFLSLAIALTVTSEAAAQTEPQQPSPGEATQQIMPSSALSASSTEGMDASDDPFADGPVEQSFDAMGPMQSMPRIVLFDGADFSGRRLGLAEDDADLSDRSFSAIASSVRIYGGAWELCDAINFTGHCREFSANTNLEADGFADKAASVRLIDR